MRGPVLGLFHRTSAFALFVVPAASEINVKISLCNPPRLVYMWLVPVFAEAERPQQLHETILAVLKGK